MNRRGFLKRMGALMAVPVIGANFSELVPVERPVLVTVPEMPRRGPVTLVEWALEDRGESARRMEGALVELFEYSSPVIKMAPKSWASYEDLRRDALPGVSWRKVNEPYTETPAWWRRGPGDSFRV